MKTVVFLEGVSGVGKTILCTRTLGLSKYLQNYPELNKKNDFAHINYAYNNILINDLLKYLEEINKEVVDKKSLALKNADNKKPLLETQLAEYEMDEPDVNYELINRSHYSTVGFDILFKYNGDSLPLHEFQREVINNVFNNREYCALLKNLFKSWRKLFQRYFPEIDVQLVWVIPKRHDVAIENVRKRANTGITIKNPEYFVQNQCWLFERLACIIQYGHLLYVDKYATQDVLDGFVKFIRCAN